MVWTRGDIQHSCGRFGSSRLGMSSAATNVSIHPSLVNRTLPIVASTGHGNACCGEYLGFVSTGLCSGGYSHLRNWLNTLYKTVKWNNNTDTFPIPDYTYCATGPSSKHRDQIERYFGLIKNSDKTCRLFIKSYRSTVVPGLFSGRKARLNDERLTTDATTASSIGGRSFFLDPLWILFIVRIAPLLFVQFSLPTPLDLSFILSILMLMVTFVFLWSILRRWSECEKNTNEWVTKQDSIRVLIQFCHVENSTERAENSTERADKLKTRVSKGCILLRWEDWKGSRLFQAVFGAAICLVFRIYQVLVPQQESPWFRLRRVSCE